MKFKIFSILAITAVFLVSFNPFAEASIRGIETEATKIFSHSSDDSSTQEFEQLARRGRGGDRKKGRVRVGDDNPGRSSGSRSRSSSSSFFDDNPRGFDDHHFFDDSGHHGGRRR